MLDIADDLTHAALALRLALRRAKQGQRGWVIPPTQVVKIVNDELVGSDYELVVRR
jgi:hypothetical protein